MRLTVDGRSGFSVNKVRDDDEERRYARAHDAHGNQTRPVTLATEVSQQQRQHNLTALVTRQQNT